MIHLNIVVEGPTEETFVRDVLAPYWGTKGIFAVARSVETSKKRGHVFRGGGRNYVKMRQDIVSWLKQQRNAYCTTMFDLYGLPSNFPGKSRVDPNLRSYKRVIYLEDALALDIDSERFIPYLQLHEFEALLFSDIDKLKVFYLDKGRGIEILKKRTAGYDSPELINEGQDTAPSKRIIKEIPEYKDNKVLVGPTVANAIGLEIIRKRCLHFNEWMCSIENLAVR